MMRLRIVPFAGVLICISVQAFASNTTKEKAEKAVENLNKIVDETSVRIEQMIQDSEIRSDEIKKVLDENFTEPVAAGLVEVRGLEQELRNEKQRLENDRDQAQYELNKVRESYDDLQVLYQELKSDYSTSQWIQTAFGSGFLFSIAGLAMQFMMHRRSDKLTSLKEEELSRKLSVDHTKNA